MTTSNRMMVVTDLLTLRPPTYLVDRSTSRRLCRQHIAILVVIVVVAASCLEHGRAARPSAVLRSDQHTPAPRLKPTTARRPRSQLGGHAVQRTRQPAQSLSHRWTIVTRQSTGVRRSHWRWRRVSSTDVTTRYVTSLYAVRRQLLRHIHVHNKINFIAGEAMPQSLANTKLWLVDVEIFEKYVRIH